MNAENTGDYVPREKLPDPIVDKLELYRLREDWYRENVAEQSYADAIAGVAATLGGVIFAGDQVAFREHSPFMQEYFRQTGDLVDHISQTDLVDWKGVMVAAGAWLLTNKTHRLYDHHRLSRQFDKTVAKIALANAFTFADDEQIEDRRFHTRMIRGLVSGAAAVIGYNVGAAQQLNEAIYTDLGLLTAAGLAMAASKISSLIYDNLHPPFEDPILSRFENTL